MTIQSYVIVSNDPANLTILGGPLRWDGETPYTPPAGTHTMLTDAAITAGYTFPAPPVAQQNSQLIQALLAAAIANNITYINTTTPTAVVTTLQVKALSRQVNALIRYTLGQLDTTDGT